MSLRRVIALVVAIGCHVGLLILLLKPEPPPRPSTSLAQDQPAAMHLRLIYRQVRPDFLSPPTSSPSTSPAASHTDERRPPPPREAPRKASESIGAAAMPPSASPMSAMSITGAEPPTLGDGGFRQRLQNAQGAGDIHGVPGSDIRRAPGLQLIDPMNQGVGAAMRNTQRLFGITDRHCIDVEVWENLKLEERIARHISDGDIKAQNEKYHCDRPLGLSF
jgi:hypothetical protein